MHVCMPMASAREQRCPRIAANSLVLAFPSCIWTSQPEEARVPNRIKTEICVRILYT